jgi:hypothetical protein
MLPEKELLSIGFLQILFYAEQKEIKEVINLE